MNRKLLNATRIILSRLIYFVVAMLLSIAARDTLEAHATPNLEVRINNIVVSSPHLIEFPDTLVVGELSPVIVELRNVGNTDLTFSLPPVQLSGPNADQFFVIQPPLETGNKLSPNGSTAFQVNFDPNAPGENHTATLTIATNDADSPFILNLLGDAPLDCNVNGESDELDLQSGSSADCDLNGVPDECQLNGDGDSLIDACDLCPTDPNKTAPGVCGCGSDDPNLNGDGIVECADQQGTVDDNGQCVPGETDCIYEPLDSFACVGANGFLGQINIATVINLQATPLAVQVEFLDLLGVVRGQASTTLNSKLKFDFIINDMGLGADTVGTVCVTVNGPRGSWTGGMNIYKPDFRNGQPNFGDAFDFALYYPFTNPRSGRTTVPLNTFHLGTDPQATVANWIAITDASIDGLGLEGMLRYYDSSGDVLSTKAVAIPDGGRLDFAGHEGIGGIDNKDAVGMAEFIQTSLSSTGGPAPYYLTVTRYFYDCPGASCNNFLTAFAIPDRPGTFDPLVGGASTVDGLISIVEFNNTLTSDALAQLEVFSEAGTILGTPAVNVPGRGTQHVILNRSDATGFLANESVGASRVTPLTGNISALSLFYKLDASGKLVLGFAAPLVGSPGVQQVSEFNSFISHRNTSEVYNMASSSNTVSVRYVDFLGAVVHQFDKVVPAMGTFRLGEVPLPKDTFGTIEITSTGPGAVFRNYITRQDSYSLIYMGR